MAFQTNPPTRTGKIISDTLVMHFKNPAPQYSLLPFWSLNNTLDSSKMNWQIDQMLDKGVYGAFMHAREGLDKSATPYFSAGWWTAIEAAVKHAHEKGFYTYLYDEDKWPSGSAGGRTILANPERNIKKIMRYNDFQVMGPQNIQLNFAGNPYAIFAGKINDRGVYDFTSQIDLTALAGKEWKMPPGRWAIISFTLVKDPNRQINYMDSATVGDFIHITHDEYYKRLGPYFGNTIPGVFFDEIYANSSERRNNIFWSDDFTEQFRKIKGYDIRTFLPLLILNDPLLSPVKRFDFFDVVRILYGNAWFGQYAKWAAAHHIWVTGHTTEELIQHIRQSDYFFTEGQLQVPCTDNEDFRYGFPRAIDFYNPKQISSLGHIYGKTRMAAEALGSGGYTIPLEDYRYGFSMLGVYGVNMFIPHLFHYSTERPENMNDWPPSWFYQNPYWKYFKPLANYAQRISYMLSQGKHISKVAVLYPLTQVWLAGYTSPIDDELYRETQRTLLDNHIDFDVIDPHTLSGATSNQNGLLVSNEQYDVLILPGLKAIETANMQKLNEFVANGGRLIALKELPSGAEKGTPQDPLVTGSMTKLFGFEPKEINQLQYRSLDLQQKERVLVNSNAHGGKGIFTRYLEELPSIIRKEIAADILIEGDGNEWIKYQHRYIDNRHVFYLVNSRKEKGSFLINVHEKGMPSLWNPETGEVKPITNNRIYNDRLQLSLEFQPWESYFLVITPEKSFDNHTILVTKSDMLDLQVNHTPTKTTATGWVSGNSVHRVEGMNGNAPFYYTWTSGRTLPEINFSGNWDFQLAPLSLNNQWTSNIMTDTVSIPVMQFKNDKSSVWKNIKITDGFSEKKGASRYLSNWDGDWISFYDYSMHLSEVGGGTVFFTKDVQIGSSIKHAAIDITADEGFELYINNQFIGKANNWKIPQHYAIENYLKQGPNHILVKTSSTKGLLVDGTIGFQNNSEQKLLSDESWQTSKDSINWRPAIRYASPPLGAWGKVDKPGSKLTYPIEVAYKQSLPPGTEAILKPVISGNYEVYMNDQRVNFKDHDSASIKRYLKAKDNQLLVRVTLDKESDGIQKPIQLIAGKTSMPLESWTDHQLEWYSGRAVYAKTFQLDTNYCRSDKKLLLDLGQVNHFAEIWVNDRLLTYRSWAPFSADISGYVHPGQNKISIVVANLLANEATWNMPDANIDTKEGRWWNYGSIMREKEKLISGLLGPVKIIPYSKEFISIPIAKKDR